MASRIATRLLSTTVSPTSQSTGHGFTSLYQKLSQLPNNGIGSLVAQNRWAAKGIEGSYWEVTRVKLKNEGKNGKAWGRLIWKGRPMSEKDEQIRGGLKYGWSEASKTTT